MSAGTQGFTDTRLDTNHIGKVISKILEARKLAEEERTYAESVAEKYQTSLEEAGIQRGYFFKKALRWKFGGEYKQKKLGQVKKWKSRGGLLKDAITGKSGKNKLNKFERAQALFDMFKAGDKPGTFRDKFKPLYQGFVDDPMVRPMSPLVKPGSEKKTQSALSRKKRVSKEDILDSLGAITESIQKVAESISEKNKVVAEQMIHSSVLQGMMHQQLKSNADSLDDKLQKIINALSNQTEFQKNEVAKAKTKEAEAKLERQKDVAGIVNFDNLLTKEDESKTSTTTPYDAYAQRDMWRGQMLSDKNLPQAETGAIFSGPDSGYMVQLHGNEAVVPLDNNYTQGEASAVDGKVRPKPKDSVLPQHEMGTGKFPTYEKGSDTTVNTAPITSKFGFNTTKNIIGVGGGGTTESTNLTQSMVDVMSLPMMAAGGSILAATTKYMQSLGGEGANINPEIERVARPIASVFGLPPSIVSAAKKSTSKKQSEVEKEDGMSNKNLFAKLTEGFGKLLEKMGEDINNNPPPPPPNGQSQPTDISGNEKELLKRLMIAEAGGEGVEGMAMVGQSVLNRAYLIQSGTVGAGQFNAASGSVTDVIQGENQYQPYRQGKLNRALSPEENARAEEAYNLIMNQLEFRKKIKSKFNLTDEQVNLAPAATGFRNYNAGAKLDTSQQVNEFNAGSHTFNTAGNAGLKVASSNVEVNQPALTTVPPTVTQLGQAITNNYGIKVGQEREFTHPQYGLLKAHKTRTGFDFYKGMEKLDMSPSKPQAQSIVDYFTSTNGGQNISPPPSAQADKNNQISSLSNSSDTKTSGGGITVLNTGGGQQIASAGSTPPPSGDMGVESGRNPTQDFYSNSFSIGVA